MKTIKSLQTFLFGARDFFHMEAAGGIVLAAASLLAILIANSPLYDAYHYFLNNVDFTIGFAADGASVTLKKSILLWINDGLMAIFFFLIGLEIKREIVAGELSSRERALLPALAALGGMAVPALIFWMINKDVPGNVGGWAIPAATDIAFALGVLALLGSRVPVSLKILLTAIAVIDDLGAILIIAIFYSHDINMIALYVAAAALLALYILNRRNVCRIAPYVLLGIVLWVAVLQSGIHATLAGVVAALFIPMQSRRDPSMSPCQTLEHALHPWIAFGVLPLFGFANAGVPFAGMGPQSLADPLPLGIIAGLFIGKQAGIFGMLWLAVKTGLSPMPSQATWRQIYAVSVLCGIGFTMSLFIGGLAFADDEARQTLVRLGVLLGSLLSALVGYTILKTARSR